MKEKETRQETEQTTQVHHCNWSHCKEQVSVVSSCSEKQNMENEKINE